MDINYCPLVAIVTIVTWIIIRKNHKLRINVYNINKKLLVMYVPKS